MNKEMIIELCNKIKNEIDWEFDSYSGYQEMMEEINKLADDIIKEVK